MTAKPYFQQRHPFDPLSAEEFRRVREALSKAHDVGPGWRFASIELREPSKEVMLDWRPEDIVPREAIAVVWNRDDGNAYRAIVSLGRESGDKVLSWEHLAGQHPNKCDLHSRGGQCRSLEAR
jgi:primary-amine oxidase